MVLLSAIWGLNFIFIKIGLSEASPLWLSLLRAAVGAGGAAALITPLRAWRQLDLPGCRDAMLIGILSTTAFYALLFTGLDAVLPGFAAVLTYTFPLWVAALSPAVLGHRLTPRLAAALAVGFAGVVFVSEPWSDLPGGFAWLPVAEILGAAVAWALGTVLFQRRFSRSQLLEANGFQLVGGSIGLLVLVAAFDPTSVPSGSFELVGVLAWLGILGTAVAYTIWSYLLGHTKAATLSAYLFFVPVVALVASAVVFGERLAPVQLVGVGLVLASIYGVGAAPEAHDLGPTALGGTSK